MSRTPLPDCHLLPAGLRRRGSYTAVDIGVPDTLILALPTNAAQPITDSDANGDVIIVLGADAPP